MIKPNGRQFYLFIQYQLFACSVSGTHLRWLEHGRFEKKEKEKSQLFIDSLKSFPQGFFLSELLSRFLVPVSDSVVAVPRDLRAWHVCLMILTVLIASVCVRVCPASACARAHVCSREREQQDLLSINILAVMNSSCQKDISSMRKHREKTKKKNSL